MRRPQSHTIAFSTTQVNVMGAFTTSCLWLPPTTDSLVSHFPVSGSRNENPATGCSGLFRRTHKHDMYLHIHRGSWGCARLWAVLSAEICTLDLCTAPGAGGMRADTAISMQLGTDTMDF